MLLYINACPTTFRIQLGLQLKPKITASNSHTQPQKLYGDSKQPYSYIQKL
jgi:hypothetical protein